MNWTRFALVAAISLLLGIVIGMLIRGRGPSTQPVIAGVQPYKEGYPMGMFVVADPEKGTVTAFEASRRGVTLLGSARY